MIDFLFDIIGFFLIITVSFFCCFVINSVIESSKDEIELEIVEHIENFNVYQECFELNDKYYCRNEE